MISTQEFISTWESCSPHNDLITTQKLPIDQGSYLWAYEVKAGRGGYQKDTCVIRYTSDSPKGYKPVLAEGFSFSHLKYNEINWNVKEGAFKGTFFRGNIIIYNTEVRVLNHESLGQSFPLEHCRPVL
jgi:hypothetical protein